MQILMLFLRQLTCAFVGELKNFDNIKMHGTKVKITERNIANCYSMILIVLLLHEIGLYEYGDLHRVSTPVYSPRSNWFLKGF